MLNKNWLNSVGFVSAALLGYCFISACTPYCTMVLLSSVTSFTKDVSLDLKYSEIYNQTFVVKKELFLCQDEDTNKIYLDKDLSIFAYDIGKVEIGTKLTVKKILFKERWGGNTLRILVEIDDPKFSAYKVNSRFSVDANKLTTDLFLAYNDAKAEFDPELLMNVEARSDLQKCISIFPNSEH